MEIKEKLKNLSRKQKVIIAFWVVVFVILLFQSMRVPQAKLEENCAEFTRNNGCHMDEEQIRQMEAGQRLYELIEGTGYETPKEACGCVTYNITDL